MQIEDYYSELLINCMCPIEMFERKLFNLLLSIWYC